jgi:hypothetical protein
MTECASISFTDAESGDTALAVIRRDDRRIALTLSLESNGDIEVFLAKADARRLLAALREAID